MDSIDVPNSNVLLRPPPNWDEKVDGPCHDLSGHVGVLPNSKTMVFTSVWRPTVVEIDTLLRGGYITLSSIGFPPPPVLLQTVEPGFEFPAAGTIPA